MNTTLVRNLSLRISAQKSARVLGTCLGLLLFCSPAFAQLNLGRILGSVTDQTGGEIAGATVTVIDVARGINRPLTTDGAGEYNAPSLIPGTYTVRAEAKGFKATERPNVLVEVGTDVRVDLTLQPGEQTQTITVTESIPLINTTNAQIGGVLENQEISELPINGREFEKLLIYRPGVRANGLDIYVNGNRADNNMWLLDGLDDYNLISSSGPIAGGQSGFDQATILPIDAIQEVNVIQAPTAEYGWKVASENNVGLKSGTNAIHGTATAFGRDASLDARNPFVLQSGDDTLEQFGATIGGPIKKDKLFYFLAYEGQRYTIGSPHTANVPATLPGAGALSSFPDAIAAMEIPVASGGPGYCNPTAAGCGAAGSKTTPLSQLSLNLAGCTLPAGLSGAATCSASAGLFPNPTASAIVPINIDNVGGSDNGIGKVDYHYSDHHSFNAEYFLGEGHVAQAASAIQPYWRSGHFTRGDVGRAVWVWTPSSTWLNEFRAGYEAQQSPQGPFECNNPAAGAPNYASSFGLVTGLNLPSPICGFPSITITGGFASLGTGSGQISQFQTASFLDTVSYTRGKHAFKFGVEMHFSGFYGFPGSTKNLAGSVSFGTNSINAFSGATPLEDYLAGDPSTASVIVGDENRHATYDRYASFVQDEWRLTPRVILNAGVRWEYVAPISERNNLLAAFNPASPTGTGLEQLGIQTNQLYHTPKANFGPRLGVAWDITGKGTTVVRSGFTIVDNSDQSIKIFLSTGNAGLGNNPTGFKFVNSNGTVAQAAGQNGNIAAGTATLAAGTIPWALNAPIFAAASPSSLPACGNGLGSVNAAAATGAANPANPSPCAINTINPNLRRAYVSAWNLSLQHAFTNTLSLNVAYIGDHGTHLGGNVDLNQPVPGAANTKTAPNEQTSRPFYSQFPYFSSITDYTDFARSNYNSVQVTLNERAGHGLNVTANYSYSHSLDDSAAETGYTATYSGNPNLDYAYSDQDPRNNFSLKLSYAIPGRKAPGQMLQGWEVNTVVHAIGGVPFDSYDTSNDLFGTGSTTGTLWTLVGSPNNFVAGTTQGLPCYGIAKSTFAAATNASGQPACITVAAGTASNPVANMPAACVTAATNEPTNPAVPAAAANSTGLKSLASFGCYFSNGSVIVPPAQGTFGTMARTALRAAPFQEWDMSISKSWKFKERLTAQFRAEAFNIINHTQFAQPASNIAAPGTFGIATATPNSNNPIVGEGGPRQIQFGLKLIF